MIRLMLTLLIIMWDCPGSAAIGHLLLSEHTYSHFAQVTSALYLKHWGYKNKNILNTP